ncbi:hypothetical protein QA640_22805 [Bradyrhizobium sp. CB82]|uniref:hypothetical protein n=1 Tax=Bradyrhizobium sp. CB82 TaxID=3039159 RepID=UPI0024B1DA0A|nr:hypothetical protein [Bradyrhizobium sp. CB82]WFU37325.1 hypothetical protein QA640_22805 [Bradyrhizobium sp. CB82]
MDLIVHIDKVRSMHYEMIATPIQKYTLGRRKRSGVFFWRLGSDLRQIGNPPFQGRATSRAFNQQRKIRLPQSLRLAVQHYDGDAKRDARPVKRFVGLKPDRTANGREMDQFQ